MKIGIDLDGCAYPFVQAFGNYCAFITGRPRAEFGEAEVWEFWTQWGMSKEEWLRLFADFTDAHGFNLLPPVEGFKEAMEQLVDAGHTIYITTARGSNVYSAAGQRSSVKYDTINWLARFSIPHHGLIFTVNKQDVNCDIFIDDYTKHLEDIRSAGKTAVAFDQLHNKGWDGLRVASWMNFVGIVEYLVTVRKLEDLSQYQRKPGLVIIGSGNVVGTGNVSIVGGK